MSAMRSSAAWKAPPYGCAACFIKAAFALMLLAILVLADDLLAEYSPWGLSALGGYMPLIALAFRVWSGNLHAAFNAREPASRPAMLPRLPSS